MAKKLESLLQATSIRHIQPRVIITPPPPPGVWHELLVVQMPKTGRIQTNLEFHCVLDISSV